jgi:hypothetical protein
MRVSFGVVGFNDGKTKAVAFGGLEGSLGRAAAPPRPT